MPKPSPVTELVLHIHQLWEYNGAATACYRCVNGKLHLYGADRHHYLIAFFRDSYAGGTEFTFLIQKQHIRTVIIKEFTAGNRKASHTKI